MKLQFQNRLSEFETTLAVSDVKMSDTVIMFLEDDKTVGYVVYRPEECKITKFEILDDYRGQGLGEKALLLFLKLIGKVEHFVRITARNEDVVPFYEKYGFTLISESSLAMEKKL